MDELTGTEYAVLIASVLIGGIVPGNDTKEAAKFIAPYADAVLQFKEVFGYWPISSRIEEMENMAYETAMRQVKEEELD